MSLWNYIFYVMRFFGFLEVSIRFRFFLTFCFNWRSWIKARFFSCKQRYIFINRLAFSFETHFCCAFYILEVNDWSFTNNLFFKFISSTTYINYLIHFFKQQRSKMQKKDLPFFSFFIFVEKMQENYTKIWTFYIWHLN